MTDTGPACRWVLRNRQHHWNPVTSTRTVGRAAARCSRWFASAVLEDQGDGDSGESRHVIQLQPGPFGTP